jgi:hypothetical protein
LGGLMNDMYQRIQLAGEQQDSAKIVAVLADIKAGRLKNDLKLLNFFQEIPVSYAASVESIEESFAELRVHQVQAVVISVEKVTILKSSHFPRDVISNVSYVNIEKSLIVLSSFSYALVRADRRMSVRVELSEQIQASFTCQGTTTSGLLHDMSLTGISITLEQNPGISLSQKGELTVKLPQGTIKVPASLLKIANLEDGCRLIFEIEATRATENNISQYIFKRQVEIIKELKEHPGIIPE